MVNTTDDKKFTLEEIDKRAADWRKELKKKEMVNKVAKSEGFTRNLPEMMKLPDELRKRIKNGTIVDEQKSSSRKKIVDWDQVANACLESEIVNVQMVKDYVLTSYPEKENIHYSEVYRFLNKRSNAGIRIEKVEIKAGKDKNVFYVFSKTGDKPKVSSKKKKPGKDK